MGVKCVHLAACESDSNVMTHQQMLLSNVFPSMFFFSWRGWLNLTLNRSTETKVNLGILHKKTRCVTSKLIENCAE